jgi:hypothetical protein
MVPDHNILLSTIATFLITTLATYVVPYADRPRTSTATVPNYFMMVCGLPMPVVLGRMTTTRGGMTVARGGKIVARPMTSHGGTMDCWCEGAAMYL